MPKGFSTKSTAESQISGVLLKAKFVKVAGASDGEISPSGNRAQGWPRESLDLASGFAQQRKRND